MDEKERNDLLMKARLESTALRDNHRANEREVLKRIHSNMTDEQSNKGKKRKAKAKSKDDEQSKRSKPSIEPIEMFALEEYVAVAYQDAWYPGCVTQIVDDNTARIRFMTPCRKPGFYQWPNRKDEQIVSKQFVFCKIAVPDCVNAGRQWFVGQHESISKMYGLYHASFLS